MFMAAIALDPLEYTHALEEAGFTRDQAEFETHVLSTTELRIKDVDTKMDLRFKDVDAKFGKLYIMGGIIIATTVIPALQKLFAWLG
jgi:hypothetical protein